MVLMPGFDAAGALCEALGISDREPVRRLVIVCDVESALTVFVERLVHDDQFDALRATLARVQRAQIHEVRGLEVDEQGRVFVQAAEHAALREAAQKAAEILTRYSATDSERAVGSLLFRLVRGEGG